MPKMTALVDDFDGTSVLIPGAMEYATVVTTVYDAEGHKVEERRLYAGAQHFDKLPGGEKVHLKKRKNGAAEDTTAASESDETEATGRTRRS